MEQYRLVSDRYGNESVDVSIDDLRALCAEFGWKDTLEMRSDGIYDDEGLVATRMLTIEDKQGEANERAFAVVEEYYHSEHDYPKNWAEFQEDVSMFRRVYGCSNQDMEILEKYFERTLWS